MFVQSSPGHMPFSFLQYTALPACCNCSLFFYYLEFTWGCVSLPLSSEASHTLAAITGLTLSKHTGGGAATPAFSHQLVYLQFVWKSGPPWLSRGECYSLACCYKPFPLQAHWGRGCCSCLLQPAYLFTAKVGCAPPRLSGAQGALPSLLGVFLILFFCSAACLLFSLVFFSFLLGWGSVWPGGYADLQGAA
jgi:hypothetical protein